MNIFLLLSSFLLASTSVSDQARYKRVCQEAALNEAVFAHFKTHPDYNWVLEGYPKEVGAEYQKAILEECPALLNNIEIFKDNDRFGGPLRFTYPEIDSIAPTTLGYIYNAGMIDKLLGSWEGKVVCEIGGGYGGQCLILSKLHPFSHYHIFDLKEVNALTEKYLRVNQIDRVTTSTLDEKIPETIDLLISNYAYAECTPEVRRQYLTEVISRAKTGYMVLNVSQEENEQMVAELKELGFTVDIYPNIPKYREETIRVVFY